MFSAYHSLESIPEAHTLDPPFREIDFGDVPAVRTCAALYRALWRIPPLPETASIISQAGEDETAQRDALIEYLFTWLGPYSRLPEDERLEMTRDPETEATETFWRRAVYAMWMNVFNDTTAFLWDVNGRTIGHLHSERDAGGIIGHLVLRHGEGAMTHEFEENVLISLAFLNVGVEIRAESLPVDKGGYLLEGRRTLDTFKQDSGTKMWFVRRGVPVEFFVDPEGEGEEVEGRDGVVAAVLVYARLCVDMQHYEGIVAAYEEQEAREEEEGGRKLP